MSHNRVMDEPDERMRLDHMKQGVLSKPVDRIDGRLKVAGQAPYAAEYSFENMAEGRLVRSTIAKGRVIDIDVKAAKAMPGVIDVIVDERMVTRAAQGTAGQAPVQDPSKVGYFGQPIALVVAESFEQARAAEQALSVRYESVGDMPQDWQQAEIADEDHDVEVDQGDIEQAMRDAAHAVDLCLTTAPHDAAAMEPHAAVASWEGGKVTLHGSLQMMRFNRKELADALDIDLDKVHILAPYVGGGFGSKLGISPECVGAAIAAQALNRPVRVVMSRQQVFQMIGHRAGTEQRLRLGADKDGRLIAFGHEARTYNLPGESFSEPVTQASQFLYAGENRKLGIDVARVHRALAASVRAPGEAVGMQTLEVAMDVLAEKVGIDPVEFRKRNIPDKHPSEDIPFSSRKLVEALDRGAEMFGWDGRKAEPCSTREGEWWIGRGMSSAARVNYLGTSNARVTIQTDGTLLVECDLTDIGTGSYTILAQIAAEMLGSPIDKVEVRLGDTDLPSTPGSGGSWGASSAGSSVFQACEALRLDIADRMGGKEEELDLKDGQATLGSISKPVSELVGNEPLVREGQIKGGKMGKAVNQATYGAFFTEVAVNAYTGETRVRRMTGAFGIGRVLNAKTARSQCLGGMSWGIGSALTEELVFDPRDGHIVNDDLAEYHIPVNRDVPHLDVAFVEERDVHANPMQSKGVGELGICGAAGSIANAIYNACGVRVYDFPITPDKIMAGLPDV